MSSKSEKPPRERAKKPRRDLRKKLAKPDIVAAREGEKLTSAGHPSPSDEDVRCVMEFLNEACLAKLILEEADEARRTAHGPKAVYKEQLYRWYVKMLAPAARENLGNLHPFKGWIISREAAWWSVAHRKLTDFLREEKAEALSQQDQDAALREIGRLLGRSLDDIREVIFEKDSETLEMSLSNKQLTVQQVLKQGGGPHRAALRALSRLLGVEESKISDRLRRVFFFRPGQEGDPGLKR